MLPIPSTRLNPKWQAALRSLNVISPCSDDDVEVLTFTPEYGKGLTGTPIDELYTTLFKKNSKAKLEALKCAVLCLAQASLRSFPETYVYFHHMRSTTHTALPKRYTERHFSNTIMTQVLDALTEVGLTRYHKGFKGPSHPKGLTTIWSATELFDTWIDKHINKLSLQTFHEDAETIVLKNGNGKLVDYADSPQVIGMRASLVKSNTHRQGFQWAYMPFDRLYWQEAAARRGKSKREYTQFIEGIEQRPISKNDLTCKRSFKLDFAFGGRLYCNAQSLSKAERATITINGNSTVEIDLKSLHPRLLYNLEGLEAPHDCYAANTQGQRQLNKEVCMLVLNCKSKAEAVKALTYHTGLDTEDAMKAVEDFVTQHTPIAHTFFKSQWKRLQNIDGQLANSIVSECVKTDIPVLPIHDSFITTTQYAYQLEEIIIETYRDLTGFRPIVTWPENKEADKVYDELLDRFEQKVAQTLQVPTNYTTLCEN